MIIGQTRGRHPRKTFSIWPSDRLFHQYIIGQTGTGKSTLLFQLMKQDSAHRQGFCLIDPHGDLAETVRTVVNCETVYWNPADPFCPHGYNPLTHVSEKFRPLIASGLIDTLKKQWPDAWGARMEHLLRYALLALLERPGSDLRDITPLFTIRKFQQEILGYVTDPQVRSFWCDEFPKMNYKTAIDGVAPIANKLGAFLANPLVRKAVCEPDEPLRFRKMMDEGTNLVVNLAKGKLGADISNILGGMIVSNFALAAYSRAGQPEAERKPYFLYVDEFHSFTTSAFADMLSELRKYRLALVLSQQYTGQISNDIFQAILGNIGTLIAFRVGATDAAILTKQFAADIPELRDLVNLGNYEMFVRLMIDGRQSKPFSARSL